MGAALAYSKAAYRSAEFGTLSQKELIVRLYCGIERFMNDQAAALRERRIEDAAKAARRTRDILFELLATLNHQAGGEVARQLNDLYLFLIDQVTMANLRQDPAMVTKAVPIVATLRDGWERIPEEHANVSSFAATETRNALDVKT